MTSEFPLTAKRGKKKGAAPRGEVAKNGRNSWKLIKKKTPAS